MTRVDPTKTKTIRMKFIRELNKRFRALKKNLKWFIDVNDSFGLKNNNSLILNKRLMTGLWSIQLNLTNRFVLEGVSELHKQLDSKDVLELETEPHITVRYGFMDSPSSASLFLDKETLFCELLGLGVFKSYDKDVLYVEVKSDELEQLNALTGLLPNESKFNEYRPHLTLAYLKPGTGDKYLELLNPLEGMGLITSTINLVMSSPKREQTSLIKFATHPSGSIIKIHTEEEMNSALSLGYQVSEQSDFGGLFPPGTLTVNTGEFAFLTDSQKIDEFEEWLNEELSDTIDPKGDVWQTYIADGYTRGAGRAFREVNRYVELAQGAESAFVTGMINGPETVEKVKLLSSRLFTDLSGYTEILATQLRKELVDGLVTGTNPREIARNMTIAVDRGRYHAERIARTEVVRAHAEGQLDSMDRLGVETVGAMVEWHTAGDRRVCLLCRDLEGIVLKLNEARGMIPRHPNCRCAWMPANIGESTQGQVRSRSGIVGRIQKSISREKRSRWVGGSNSISKKRPTQGAS